MKHRLVIEPEAEDDLRETYRWYEAQRAGLGEEYLLAVEAALSEMRRRPESFQRYKANSGALLFAGFSTAFSSSLKRRRSTS